MTEKQMAYWGFDRLNEESVNALDPAVQRQLLKGRKAYQCRTCKKITWVPIGAKEDDFREYDIHLHVTSYMPDIQE